MNFMVRRNRIALFLLLVLPVIVAAQDTPDAESGEEPVLEAQASATIRYNPEQTDIFESLDNMKVVYVANFWNTRRGTRLALRENIHRPDSSRLMTAPLEKTDAGWEAVLTIPPNAAVLSYYITDGEAIDDNHGDTFTAYVYTRDNVPVPNAHYFMVPFLELAGAGLEERLRESEQEILSYPRNFRAYTQYFQLYMEIERGSQRGQARIVQRLQNLEEQFGEKPDCLNLIARTYYYILRDQKTGLQYKERIPVKDRWREVEAMFDPEAHNEQQRERLLRLQRTQGALLNTEAPPIDFIDGEGRLSVQELKGQPVLLIFWATTSDLSLELFNKIKAQYDVFEKKNVVVLAVNAGESQEAVDAFRKKHDFPFRWVLNNGAALLMYGVGGLPQSYIIDKDGIIRDLVVGFEPATMQKIRTAIEKLP